MPPPCTQWDPYGVLNIDKSSTVCYGWAPSQGRNCRNPISQANHQEATSILSRLTTIDPSSDLGPRLQTLAHLLLCKRNHQNQAESVVARWKKRMDRIAGSSIEAEAEGIRRIETVAARRQRQIAQILRGDVIAESPLTGTPRTAVPSSYNSPSVRIPPRPLDVRERQSGTSVLTPSATPRVPLSGPRRTFEDLDETSTVDMLFENLDTSRTQYHRWLEERGLPESATPEVPLSAFRETLDNLDGSGTADMIFEILGTSRSQIRRGLEEREQAEARRPLIRPGSGFQTWEGYLNWMARASAIRQGPRRSHDRVILNRENFDRTPFPLRVHSPAARQSPQSSHRPEASNRRTTNSISPDAGTEYSSRSPPSPATPIVNTSISPSTPVVSTSVSPIAMIHPRIALNPAMLATSGSALTRRNVRGESSTTRPTVQQPRISDSSTTISEPSSDCSICYEDLQDGKSLVSCKVQCSQRFHEECIKTWFQNSDNRTCPYW